MSSPQSRGARSRSSPAIRFSVLAGVVLALLATLVILFGRRPAPPSEALRTELHLVNGRLYRTGDERSPFTGVMIERYASGVLKSRSMISNGILHGVSEGWHTNGQMQVREHFTNGVSHGLRVRWHENGVKLSEAAVVSGKLQGGFRRWHDNGKLAEEMELNQDVPDGLARSYYPSGFMKAQARLKNGQVTEQNFWKDGELNEGSGARTAN